MDISEIRARNARRTAAYYKGETNDHPHGFSGKRFILTPEDDRRCLGTSPRAYAASEWAFGAGISFDDMGRPK